MAEGTPLERVQVVNSGARVQISPSPSIKPTVRWAFFMTEKERFELECRRRDDEAVSDREAGAIQPHMRSRQRSLPAEKSSNQPTVRCVLCLTKHEYSTGSTAGAM